jgi:hypothetical protein
MLGSKPWTVATGALAVRRSNHLARSHPHQRNKHFDVILTGIFFINVTGSIVAAGSHQFRVKK